MAKKPAKSFVLEGIIEPIAGSLNYSGVIFPQYLVDQLPEGRLRTEGNMNGIPFNLAIQNLKGGFRYFTISAALRREAKVKDGQLVKIAFTLVDPEKLEIPEELEVALAQDDDAMKIWDGFTTGKKRSLAHYVSGVKSIDARIKRALELMYKMKTNGLYSQVKAREKN
jgi:Bacteriocin-protection, YdeI or OmpD-Associated/Domain of unknown function (DUF1905)